MILNQKLYRDHTSNGLSLMNAWTVSLIGASSKSDVSMSYSAFSFATSSSLPGHLSVIRFKRNDEV
jgi:hypothetical protein